MEELAQELWDSYSTYIDDNISSLETIAGNSVIKKSDFFKMMSEVIDKRIHSELTEMITENPMKFTQYAMLVIGRDIQKSNAESSIISFDADLEDGKRFEIKMTTQIKELDGK